MKHKTNIKPWRPLYALYALIYLPWFFTLEHFITIDTPGIHILNNAIDEKIPFCEYFIIPYLLWFLYIAASCVFMMLYSTDSEFIRFALSLIIGMSAALIICMIYPNGITLRPHYIPDNLCGKLVKLLYHTDTSTNVFPSIHVYNSLAVHIALNRCSTLKDHRGVRLASLVLCVLIIMSTVFLKQHSVTDVVGGIVLTAVLYIIIYIPDYKRLLHREKKSSVPDFK